MLLFLSAKEYFTKMQPAIPRYTQRAMPGYRYLPTRHPHPILHPEGHSFKKSEQKSEPLIPEKWMQNEIYLYGVDLYNHGFWWEAHEAWEAIWLTTRKSDLSGLFLQGLIQFSAALLKLYGGSKRGFDNLWREAQKKLYHCQKQLQQGRSQHYLGIDLPEWIHRIELFFNSLEVQEGDAVDPLKYSTFPALLLEDKGTSP